MNLSEFQYLTNIVLGCIFGLSFLLGVVCQRTHFCTMGAVSDVYLMRDWGRATQWAIATLVTTLGFGALCVNGLLEPTQTLYYSTKWFWASSAAGGVLFGAGMVLCSGCGLKSLVRAGSGNLKSWVVLIIMGIFAFMTLKGFVGVLRVQTIDLLVINFVGGANWANLLGYTGAQQWGWFGIVGASLFIFVLLIKQVSTQGSALTDGFIAGYKDILVGVFVGALFIAAWWVCSALAYVPEHPQTLESVYVASKSGRIEAFSFVGPVAYFWNWLEFFSDQSNVLTTGVVSVIGVFVGAWLSALRSGTFRWEGFTQTQDLGLHMAGAAMMGVGGVLALGCSVGQGISGFSTLSLNASSATLGIILGAWLCLHIRASQ